MAHQDLRPRPTHPIALIAAALCLTACDGDDDSAVERGAGSIDREDVSSYYTASNAAGGFSLYRSDDRYEGATSFDGGYGEGIAMDYDGTVFVSGNGPGGPAIRAVDRARERMDGEVFDPARDREIAGPATTLVEPGDLTLSRREGLLFVTDRGMNAVSVFGTGVSGNVEPLAVTRMASRPMATAYGEETDRLFVAREDGFVDVYDDYVGSEFQGAAAVAAPSRSLQVRRRVGFPGAYANIGGIEYDEARDELYLSDMGLIGDEVDGGILRVANASTVDGDVEPALRVGGAFSRLRDPRGFELREERLRVADPGSGRMYQYVLGDAEFGEVDRAPFSEALATDPRAVATEPRDPQFGPMPSDIDDPALAPVGVTSVSTPGLGQGGEPLATNGIVNRYDFATGTTRPFNADLGDGTAVGSLAYDGVGDGYLGYENETTGRAGVLVASRLAGGRRRTGIDDRYHPSRDRLIEGPNTGITSPRGIDVDDRSGHLFVADEASQSIRVFQRGAVGDVPPLFSVNLPAGPQGIDYDPTNDRLYAAGNDGLVNAYDNFLAQRPSQPSRRFGFDDGQTIGFQESRDLRGLSYDETNDRLLVSDYGTGVGSADGRIYGATGASFAQGVVTPTVRRTSTAGTTLTDPGGVLFDGSTLYASDSASGSLYQYDQFYSSTATDPAAAYGLPRAGGLAFQASAGTPLVGGSYR